MRNKETYGKNGLKYEVIKINEIVWELSESGDEI